MPSRSIADSVTHRTASDKDPLKCSNAIQFSVTQTGQAQIIMPLPICVHILMFELRPHVLLLVFVVEIFELTVVSVMVVDILREDGVDDALPSRILRDALSKSTRVDTMSASSRRDSSWTIYTHSDLFIVREALFQLHTQYRGLSIR